MRRWVRISSPPSNRMSRFLPIASTAVISWPTIRWTCGTGPGPLARAAVTVRPTRYGRSPAAVRKSVSPSGTQPPDWEDRQSGGRDRRPKPGVPGDHDDLVLRIELQHRGELDRVAGPEAVCLGDGSGSHADRSRRVEDIDSPPRPPRTRATARSCRSGPVDPIDGQPRGPRGPRRTTAVTSPRPRTRS